MFSALLKIVRAAAKYGPKVLKYLKAAFDVIWRYGMKAVNWVCNNIGKIVNAIGAAVSIKEFIEWLVELFKEIF